MTERHVFQFGEPVIEPMWRTGTPSITKLLRWNAARVDRLLRYGEPYSEQAFDTDDSTLTMVIVHDDALITV